MKTATDLRPFRSSEFQVCQDATADSSKPSLSISVSRPAMASASSLAEPTAPDQPCGPWPVLMKILPCVVAPVSGMPFGCNAKVLLQKLAVLKLAALG